MSSDSKENKMSAVELGTVQNSLHPQNESTLKKIEEMAVEQKNEYGKKLILKLTKVKDFELDGKCINFFLLTIVSISAAVFGFFLWYFLCATCSPVTQTIQAFYSDSVYSSAFNNPQGGLHICQSFFQGSKIQCGQISAATLSPSMTPKPSAKPTTAVPTTEANDDVATTDDSASDESKFCLIPCVLPGFNCNADYNTFNEGACALASSNELTTFYGSLSGFDCSFASTVSCTYQQIPDTDPAQFFYTPGAPAPISVIYLSCNSVGQAFLNAV